MTNEEWIKSMDINALAHLYTFNKSGDKPLF